MIQWQKCAVGITSKPRGGLSESLNFATGIFVIRPVGRAWQLELSNGIYVDDGVEKTFSFRWGFSKKERCMEYAEALVSAYGLDAQVHGTAEPSEEDLRVVKWWKATRKEMGY